MVHLSVAIGRFFEALLWAVARSVGMVTGWVVLGAIAVGVLAVLVRAGFRPTLGRLTDCTARAAVFQGPPA